MKQRRWIRTSRRVSSETGVAITAVQPPRRAMLAELAREEMER